MSLKEKLGEELYEQVQEKLGDDKIAIVSDGSYVPKEKFDEKNQEAKDYKGQLKERDDQLKDLKDKAQDNETLNNRIKELQDKNKEQQDEYQQKLTKQQKDSKLDLKLRESGFKYPDLVKGKFDLEKINLSDEGELIGFNEQVEPIKESYPDLLRSEEDDLPDGIKKRLKGKDPHVSDQNKLTNEPNPFSKEHFNLTKQAKLMREEPELAQKLKAKAKG